MMMRLGYLLVLASLAVGCEYQVSGCDGPLCVNAGNGPVISAGCESEAGCATRCPSAQAVDENMLREVTLARRFYASCPNSAAPQFANMTFDGTLDDAAYVHAEDMARYGFVSAIGSDGLDVEDRVDALASGSYSLDNHLAQLVASGAHDAAGAVDYWLSNPAQCALLLSDKYSHLGSACSSRSGDYSRWSLVLGGS